MEVKKILVDIHMHNHSKIVIMLMGIVAIVIGVWVWMCEPTLIQIIAVLLVLMGIKKLIIVAKCC